MINCKALRVRGLCAQKPRGRAFAAEPWTVRHTRTEREVNIKDIDATLPNGLHDMLVERLTIDFIDRIATLDVSVWIGDLASALDAEREARRRGKLLLHGLQFCVLEPPDPRYPFADSDALWLVDLLDADPNVVGSIPLPPQAFSARFFVNQWNSFVHVAALDATLVWE